MVLDLKENDWVECEGCFCLLAKVRKILVDSFEGNVFFRHLDAKSYSYLGVQTFRKEIINRKINDVKFLKELEECYAVVNN
jgi:hypothetical protein